MFNHTEIMKSAWTHYRRMVGKGRLFNRKLFADVLRFIWKEACIRVEAIRAEVKRFVAASVIAVPVAAPLSPMEARIDALKYLSSRYRIGIMEREIRAGYATA